MPKATWHGAVIAASDACITIEGNVYFPPAAVNAAFMQPSDTRTVCGWKGTANYYDIVIDGVRNKDAAWYYPEPKPAASEIAGYIAFWRGVTIER